MDENEEIPNDEIIKELDVYLSKTLMDNLYLFQVINIFFNNLPTLNSCQFYHIVSSPTK
jgi:hypothetical protein